MPKEMSHLVIERLADLADGEPLPEEREHLAECAMCASELASYRRLVGLAADERRRIAPPLTDWGSLRSRLFANGVIVARVPEHPITFAGRVMASTWRVAAVFAFMVGATVFGRLTAGLSLHQALSLAAVRFAPLDSATGDSLAGMTGSEFASTAAALNTLRRAQDEYNRAARYLAVNDTASVEQSPEVYRDRLALLDDMAKQSRRALDERPQDPVMNQIYLTALGARELTLTKLGSTLSGGTRLVRY